MSIPDLRYLLPRIARHFLPERLTRFLLLRSIFIRPGLESTDPEGAIARYINAISSSGHIITGKRILVFGYGGRFDVGVGLLEAGAEHVILCEKQAPTDDIHNSTLLPHFGRWLSATDGQVRPRSEYMTLFQGDIREIMPAKDMPLCDLVLSSSVYEHLDDVDGITCALALLTQPGGLHLHYVDLRDHFFKYPFEMLTYSEGTWRNWLNPTSHHNRFRVRDYRTAFEKYFKTVNIEILARDKEAFRNIRNRIRPEFLTGDESIDSVTLILVAASHPRSDLRT